MVEERIVWGSWSPERIDRLLHEASRDVPGEQRTAFLSEPFLGTPYRADTLEGDPGEPEHLVVDFEGMDCFTFLDYVEAMRRAADFRDFVNKLRAVRYRGAEVGFETRNHFFTDWIEEGTGLLFDATTEVGGANTAFVRKMLNEKKGGGRWVRGAPIRTRRLAWVPAGHLDPAALSRIQPGDYLGVYSLEPGLDVSHVGIAIKEGERTILRHASSRPGVMKVVDEDLGEYLSGRPGILVVRPLGTRPGTV